MEWIKLTEHQATDCDMRKIACPNGCPVLKEFIKMPQHATVTCVKRPETCPIGTL